MRFSRAIVLLTRTGSSPSAESQVVPGFMWRQTHVSSSVIRSRKQHLSFACRTPRSCRAPSNHFALKSSPRKWGAHLKCRLFLLREVVRSRCTVKAWILRNSVVVRTEDHGSAFKTCLLLVYRTPAANGLDRKADSPSYANDKVTMPKGQTEEIKSEIHKSPEVN
jgi:hypothetical protein